MKVVTLVPWRPGNPVREVLWEATRPHLERLGYPMTLGDSEGVWSRAGACNRASEAAGVWDVAVIADADTIPERMAVATAVQLAWVRRGGIRPHDHLYALNPAQTRMAIRRGVDKVRLSPRQRTMPGGGLLVISRPAWERVGGFDESFVGWGHEDSAMSTNLLVNAHWDRIPGEAWHLYHPRDRKDTPERQANWNRMHRLQQRNRKTIDRVSKDRGWDVGAVL